MFEEEKQKYLQKYGFETISLKAVLFDMDGVLYDSMPNHARSWSHSMTQFGLSMTPEEAYLHEGRTGKSTINLLARRAWGRDASEAEIKKIYEAKCEAFNHCSTAPPMAGALDVLIRIKACGLKILIVTGSGQQSLLDRLNQSYPGIFHEDLIVTSADVKHGKPNPEPYLVGLHKANVKPWEAMVVENAPLGIQAATAARIFTVAVNTGPLPDSVLLSSGADLLFPSMVSLAQESIALVQALKSGTGPFPHYEGKGSRSGCNDIK